METIYDAYGYLIGLTAILVTSPLGAFIRPVCQLMRFRLRQGLLTSLHLLLGRGYAVVSDTWPLEFVELSTKQQYDRAVALADKGIPAARITCIEKRRSRPSVVHQFVLPGRTKLCT